LYDFFVPICIFFIQKKPKTIDHAMTRIPAFFFYFPNSLNIEGNRDFTHIPTYRKLNSAQIPIRKSAFLTQIPIH